MIIKRATHITPYGLDRTLHIYLPAGYRKGSGHYPVLYMYDGHNLFRDEDATYGKSWGLKNYLDKRHAQLIVVGVECNHEGNQRLVEYSPYSFADRYWGKVAGTGDVYMEWLVKELKPFIDKEYRTLRDRRHTAIGGSSMGGLMSLYSIVRHNDSFSKAVCISSYIDKVMDPLLRDLDHPVKDPTLVYLSWGGKETANRSQSVRYTAENLKAADILMANGARVYLSQPVNGTHSEASWEKEVPVFLDYLFPELNK